MSQTRRHLEHALPFAMEPVVYDFAINDEGTSARLLPTGEALLPPAYYGLTPAPFDAAGPAGAAACQPRRDGRFRRGLSHAARSGGHGAHSL